MVRCDLTAVWAKLRAHYDTQGASFDARRALADDKQRVAKLSQQAPHIFVDLSKNHIDDASQALLMQLARECGLEQQRDAMLQGEHINNTEDRAVLHTLLRSNMPVVQVSTNQAAIKNIAIKVRLSI